MYSAAVLEAVRDCGTFGYLIVLLGMLGMVTGIVAVIVAAVSRGRAGLALGIASLLVAGLCLGAGAIGMLRGRAVTRVVLESVDPAMHERILEAGYREADQCMNVGGVGAGMPLVLGAAALAVALLRRRA